MQVEDAAEREALLLRHLHAAAAHGVRGVVDHRSLVCALATARVLLACRGRGGGAERHRLWSQLSDGLEGQVNPLHRAEGWADPSLEELPVDLPDDR